MGLVFLLRSMLGVNFGDSERKEPWAEGPSSATSLLCWASGSPPMLKAHDGPEGLLEIREDQAARAGGQGTALMSAE